MTTSGAHTSGQEGHEGRQLDEAKKDDGHINSSNYVSIGDKQAKELPSLASGGRDVGRSTSSSSSSSSSQSSSTLLSSTPTSNTNHSTTPFGARRQSADYLALATKYGHHHQRNNRKLPGENNMLSTNVGADVATKQSKLVSNFDDSIRSIGRIKQEQNDDDANHFDAEKKNQLDSIRFEQQTNRGPQRNTNSRSTFGSNELSGRPSFASPKDNHHYYYATPTAEMAPTMRPSDQHYGRQTGSLAFHHQQAPNRNSNLFAQPQQHIKTICDQSYEENNKLEPLIRSSSWQNRTLIDLRCSNKDQAKPGYLDSSLIHTGNPIEMNNINGQHHPEEHLYCAVSTLDSRQIYLPTGMPTVATNSHYYYQQHQNLYSNSISVRNNHRQPYGHPGGSFQNLAGEKLTSHEQQQQHYYQISQHPRVYSPSAFNFNSSSGHQLLSTGASSSTDNSDNQLTFKCNYNQTSGSGVANKSKLHRPAPLLKKANHWTCLLRFLILLAVSTLIGLSIVFYIQSPGSFRDIGGNGAQMNSLADPRGQANYRYFQYFNQTSAPATPGGGAVRLAPPFPSLPAPSARPKWADDHFSPPNTRISLAPTSQSAVTTTQLTTTTTTTTTTSTTNKPDQEQEQQDQDERLEASTQSYWALPASTNSQDFHCRQSSGQCNNNDDNDNPSGQCDSLSGLCSCSRGFSGPNCANVDCPNHCSHRGECRLKPNWPLNEPTSHPFESLAFASQTLSESRLSNCASSTQMSATQHSSSIFGPQVADNYHDHRLEWQCECQLGFAGPDCSQLMELNCQDELDDDLDGLVDCEDDDCCRSSQVCRDNLMCFKSPEPIRVLEEQAANLSSSALSLFAPQQLQNNQEDDQLNSLRFLAQWKFLISNGSVQSYAQASSFDSNRLAVIRGRVTRQQRAGPGARDGIVSVRVSVLESASFGFTLTRPDGHFDLLVNGNDWLTLQFHRNAYRPMRRKLYVKSHSINVLESDIELRLVSHDNSPASAEAPAARADPASSGGSAQHQTPFGLRLTFDLFRSLADSTAPTGRKQAQLDCLLDHLIGLNRRNTNQFHSAHEPLIVLQGHESHTTSPTWRAFALASQGSYSTRLSLVNSGDYKSKMKLNYNSATFAPSSSVVKPTIGIQLLASNFAPNLSHDFKLNKVLLQLNIEGQSRSETFEPIASLSYQFAWNRRNVYEQKVYGFSELNIRVGYEYSFGLTSNDKATISLAKRKCLSSANTTSESSHVQNKQVVWFERRVFVEAHQLNQHSDVGRWTLSESDRYDAQRELLYFGANWMLPFQLVYPPTVTEARRLVEQVDMNEELDRAREDDETGTGRLLARGPDSSMFVALVESNRLMQLDSTGNRQVINVPLSILTSKFGQQRRGQQQADLQILFNNFDSSLYLSSRAAAKIVQVSLASLGVLNKTLAGGSAALAPDDEIDLETLCGASGRQAAQSPTSAAGEQANIRSCKAAWLSGPHSMTLDETNQVLYFVDGQSSILALDLASNLVADLLDVVPFRARAASHAGCQVSSRSRLRSLTWSRADSSLYFIDDNSIFALRQDSTIELVVSGRGTTGACGAGGHAGNSKLGSIKSLTIDESTNGNELLVVHQNSTQVMGATRQRYYLAKIALGIRMKGEPSAVDVVDLHSSESTWNPLIRRLAASPDTAKSSGSLPEINWRELAATSSSPPKEVPFINLLSSGFERVDSIEINLIGSIFVLNSLDQSLRLVETYSPSRFSRLQRNEPNLNRLFALGEEGEATHQMAPPNELGAQNEQQTRSQHKFGVVEVRNPITLKLMEFHWPSGLLLRTWDHQRGRHQQQQQHQHQQQQPPGKQNDDINQANDNKTSCQFYYKILSNDQTGEYKLRARLEEDDLNDLEAQKLILNLIGGQPSGQFNDHHGRNNQRAPFIRLAGFVEETTTKSQKTKFNQPQASPIRREFQLVRSTTQRAVVKSILMNQRPVCAINVDQTGVMSSITQLSADLKTTNNLLNEFVYHPTTYLLENVITRRRQQQQADLSRNHNQQSTSVTTKRIVYDKIFSHYCDLFVS